MSKIKWHDAAECLRVLAHPHRLHMISLLLEGERSVGEIAKECEILHNVASEHLSLMKDKGFTTSIKKGKQVFYSIQEPALASIMGCIEKRFKGEDVQ